MNLEKGIWNEDPTKAWMKEYQCSNWKSHIKDVFLPALEKQRSIMNSFYFSSDYKKKLALRPKGLDSFSTFPAALIVGSFTFIKYHFDICMVQKTRIKLPVYWENGDILKNIVDAEIEHLGERDFFFSVKADSKKYGKVMVYFTPIHFEEACCILQLKKTKVQIGDYEWGEETISINDDSLERLGSMNPFSVIRV